MKKKKVVLAMSGGIDSSVTAILLKEMGYDITGVMLHLWSDPDTQRANQCCTISSMETARQIAGMLDFPFQVLDAENEFFNTIVQYFINTYSQSQTPNPCVFCNKQIKWGILRKFAKEIGAEHLATGHYARIIKDKYKAFQLLKAIDIQKDQSYFLYQLSQEELAGTIFPLGIYTKREVREIAHKYSLPNAANKESQDLCFVNKEGYQNFLTRYAPETINPGPIVSIEGNILGEHKGLAFYTIGQRKGLHIAAATPLYVIRKDSDQNTLIVGTSNQRQKKTMIVNQVNWITEQSPISQINAGVRIRFKSKEIPASIHPLTEHKVRVEFKTPVNYITPGQAAVFYQNDHCLGGGIIYNAK